MTRSTPIEQLPDGLSTGLRALSVVVTVTGIMALVTIGMPWIDETYVTAWGPPLTLGVFVLAMVGASLIGGSGPRIRWSDRAEYRERVAAARAQGMSARKAAAAARTPYGGRVRAGRAIGGGVVIGLTGWLEAYLVSANLHTFTIQGYEPGIGPDVASVVAWVLLISAAVALVLGVIGTFVPLEMVTEPAAGAAAQTGAGPFVVGASVIGPPAEPPTVWAPTHRVPIQGMPAYDEPVGGVPSVMLDPQLPLVVGERRGGWALVQAVNGWEGWVDAAQLVSIVPEAPSVRARVPEIPPMPVG